MNIYVDVGGSEALTLRGALLVYQGKSRSFVAWHEARNAEQGAPFLGEAEQLTTEFVHSLTQGLGSGFLLSSFIGVKPDTSILL